MCSFDIFAYLKPFGWNLKWELFRPPVGGLYKWAYLVATVLVTYSELLSFPSALPSKCPSEPDMATITAAESFTLSSNGSEYWKEQQYRHLDIDIWVKSKENMIVGPNKRNSKSCIYRQKNCNEHRQGRVARRKWFSSFFNEFSVGSWRTIVCLNISGRFPKEYSYYWYC